MFKKGDRVVYTAKNPSFNYKQYVGCTGTVIYDGVSNEGSVQVDWDDPDYHPSSGVYASNIALIDSTPKDPLDDLRRVVSELREQGMTVEVTVTHTTTTTV